MYTGKTVFVQLTNIIPYHSFQQYVNLYNGNKWMQSFSCWDQYLSMVYPQLTNRRSLRDIESTLEAQSHKLYHMGFRGSIRRATLAKANQNRDYRIYRDLAYYLIDIARPLYVDEDLGLDLEQTAYVLDSSTVDLCLSLFPWADFRKTKGAIKIHTLMDLQGSIPVFIDITSGKIHDINILDRLVFDPGSIVIMDRGYTDFFRLYTLTLNAVFFVIRAKKNLKVKRIRSMPVDKSTGIQCDQLVNLVGFYSAKDYPQNLRRIRFIDKDKDQGYVFLTNNFLLPAKTIADLYKYRWQIELFFKWIKQHLRIKSFYGTTINAVKTQIWFAISVYVLVAIFKKRYNIQKSLYTILQIFSLTLFEKVPILQLFTNNDCTNDNIINPNQLSLFD